MEARLITRREELAALRPEWDELALLDRRHGFFRTFAWYLAWLEHIRPDAEPFVLTLREAGGRLLGLAPLCRAAYGDMGFRLTGLGFGGREVVSGDYLDFPAVSGARSQVLSAFLSAIWDLRSSWSLLVLGELIVGGDLHCAAESWAAQNGLAARRQEDRFCPYIELPQNYEHFVSHLGRNLRQHLRRSFRRVVEQKVARLEILTERQELVAGLEELVRLHLMRWRLANDPGTLGRPGIVAFLRKICTEPPPGARSRIYLLKQEEKVVASLLAFHFGEVAIYYQAGWDPELSLARYSPGLLMLACSIEDAIRAGLRYYDLLRGNEEYKSEWTKTFRNTTTLVLARSAMARAYLSAVRAKDFAKRLVLSRRQADVRGSRPEVAQNKSAKSSALARPAEGQPGPPGRKANGQEAGSPSDRDVQGQSPAPVLGIHDKPVNFKWLYGQCRARLGR